MSFRVLARCCVPVLLLLGCGESSPPSEGERQVQRLDRTSVHVHVTLRHRLDSEGAPARAAQLARARGDRAAADRLGRVLFEARDTGASQLREGDTSHSSLARLRLPESDLDAASDGAAYFLALVEAGAEDERSIPKQVLVYEARRLQLDEVSDEGLRDMAHAASALVFSRAGYCEQVDELDARFDPADGRTSLAAEVILGGAVACCLMRRHRLNEAADAIEEWLDEAEELGVSPAAVELLRVWTGLAQERVTAARQHLDAAREAGVLPADRAHYEMLRDAVVRTEREGSFEPSEGTLDRRWLGTLVLAFAHRAFGEEGWMGEAMGGRPEAAALRELAEGEAAVISAARARYPMFDLVQEGDRTIAQRIGDLFR